MLNDIVPPLRALSQNRIRGVPVLYDMTDGALTAVTPTTFKAEQVLERTHLQAAVRDNIQVLDPELLVVAEEFGDFEDANRRIDLLCVDRSGRLVVVELKRTDDGGHMELQALRYAAMVSVMTFDDLAQTYARHLDKAGEPNHDSDDARARLLEWIEVDEDEPTMTREVGIILVSANFSQEITTTVLWLNEYYGTDMRCVRLSPYRHGGRLLLDVQQVIPLPEAAELTVKLKKREAAAKQAKASSKDYTKYVVSGPSMSTPPLPKRRAVLAMVKMLHEAGVPASTIAAAVPHSKLRSAPGSLSGDELWAAFAAAHHLGEHRRSRWFVDEPIHDGDQTWVLSNGWGVQTEETLDALAQLAPEGYGVEPMR